VVQHGYHCPPCLALVCRVDRMLECMCAYSVRSLFIHWYFVGYSLLGGGVKPTLSLVQEGDTSYSGSHSAAT
jgi:hypothetical protein